MVRDSLRHYVRFSEYSEYVNTVAEISHFFAVVFSEKLKKFTGKLSRT